MPEGSGTITITRRSPEDVKQRQVFVSVDGTGLGISHIAVGSHRYRVTFKGPGGHSYAAFGLANPIHALGRAIAAQSPDAVRTDLPWVDALWDTVRRSATD